MKITDLQPRIIAIYAGRFHPFHHGHAEVFHSLAKKFGINNTYITTGGTVEPIKSPFSFEEKRLMMQAAGIPSNHVVQETVPYAPVNLPGKLGLDKNKDIMVFGVGQKDMSQDPRFAFTPLKNGTPSYFQRWTGKDMQPFATGKAPDSQRDGHGYIIPVPDVQFTIAGNTINSASQIRELYKDANESGRMQILNELYPAGGVLISRIGKIFDAKLGQ